MQNLASAQCPIPGGKRAAHCIYHSRIISFCCTSLKFSPFTILAHLLSSSTHAQQRRRKVTSYFCPSLLLSCYTPCLPYFLTSSCNYLITISPHFSGGSRGGGGGGRAEGSTARATRGAACGGGRGRSKGGRRGEGSKGGGGGERGAGAGACAGGLARAPLPLLKEFNCQNSRVGTSII